MSRIPRLPAPPNQFDRQDEAQFRLLLERELTKAGIRFRAPAVSAAYDEPNERLFRRALEKALANLGGAAALEEGITGTVSRPKEWWRARSGYFSNQAGTTPQTTAGGGIQCWTGSILGWKAVWDNATFGGSNPVLNTARNGITMGVYGGLEYVPGSTLFVDGDDLPFSIVVRARPTGAMNQSRCWGGFGADGSNPHHLIYTDTVGTGWYGWQSERRDDANSQLDGYSASGFMTPTTATTYTRVYTFDGATAIDRINGTVVSTSELSVGEMSPTILFIGTDSSGAIQDTFLGDMIDFLVFDHALNDISVLYWEDVMGRMP